jgi:hypothetical protein
MLKTVSSITNAIGALNYVGTWNASTNTPALASGVGTKGDYYVVSVAGSTNLDGEILWGVGDWAVYNGAAWQKVEGGNTINATTVSASTSVTTPVIQATSSAGGTLKNNGGTAQLQWGSGGGSNLSLEVATNINPANAAVAISPTGTGTVTINPATASTMNNVAIGGSTPLAGTFTALTSTGNTILGDASTDTLNVGNGGLIKNASGNVGVNTSVIPTTFCTYGAIANVGATSSSAFTGTASIVNSSAASAAAGTHGSSLVFAQSWTSGGPTSVIATGQITGVKIANDGSFGGGLAFWTSNGGGTDLAERMRISSNGIITMSAYGAGTATFSAAGVISSVSDETYKIKDGVPLNPDAMLQKLEPGYWFYNDEKKEIFGADRQLGFYAQNVNQAIGAEAAPIPEEGKPWGYYDRSVLAVVVMSLQNALSTIETLTSRIEALESK